MGVLSVVFQIVVIVQMRAKLHRAGYDVPVPLGVYAQSVGLLTFAVGMAAKHERRS